MVLVLAPVLVLVLVLAQALAQVLVLVQVVELVETHGGQVEAEVE